MANNPSLLTDEELMQRIQSGERKCFECLYERYKNKLFKFIYRFTGDREKAEDLLHDLFIKVIESQNKFDANRKFSTWVYTLTTNLCRNELRNNSNRKQLLEKHFTPDKSFLPLHNDKMDKRNFNRKLNDLLQLMNEENKTILLLRFHEELSIPQISSLINLPEGTIKSRLFYLLKKLAVQLNAYNPIN